MSKIIVSGDFKYGVIISCACCGRTEYSRHRIQLGPTFLSVLSEVIMSEYRNSTINPPVGWTAYGKSELYCPACKKGDTQE